MEFRHLMSFLALAEELHFGRAARRMHLTQPSLSQHLRHLERSVGVQLVERTSHQVQLTPAGSAFVVEARATVEQLAKAARSAREAAAGRTGTVRVGYNFPAGQHVLPAVLAHMGSEYPSVAVRLEEGHTGDQLTALANGALDVALVYGPPPSGSGVRFRTLLRLPVVAVVAPGHRWAGRPGVPFAELGSQPCVLFTRERCPAMYDAVQTAADSCGTRLNVAHMIDDSGATAILAAVQPLVAFASISRAVLAAPAAGVRLVPVRFYDPTPTVELGVVWRDDERSPLREVFLESVDAAGPFHCSLVSRESQRVNEDRTVRTR